MNVHYRFVLKPISQALVRERMDDWTRRIAGGLGKRVVELTGTKAVFVRV